MIGDVVSERWANEVATLLHTFEERPTAGGLMDLTAIVELIQTLPELRCFANIRKMLAASALRWTRSGRLAGILISRADYGYAVAMLLALASEADGFLPADIVPLRDLYNGKVIGFSELPILTLRSIAQQLATAKIATASKDTSPLNIRSLIDKRVLRTRTDEYDVITLMMASQLLPARSEHEMLWPRVFPNVMLVKALRAQDLNWTAILSLLAKYRFGAPEALLRAARKLLAARSGSELLPAPHGTLLYSEFFERSDIGLRLRGTLARQAFLEGETD